MCILPLVAQRIPHPVERVGYALIISKLPPQNQTFLKQLHGSRVMPLVADDGCEQIEGECHARRIMRFVGECETFFTQPRCLREVALRPCLATAVGEDRGGSAAIAELTEQRNTRRVVRPRCSIVALERCQ